jgi:hypothetical protein
VQVILQEKSPTHHFFMAVTTDRDIYPVRIDATSIYKALLQEAIPFFQGEKNNIRPLDELAESIKVLLACKEARESGKAASIQGLEESEAGYDGAAFAAGYRKAKRSA